MAGRCLSSSPAPVPTFGETIPNSPDVCDPPCVADIRDEADDSGSGSGSDDDKDDNDTDFQPRNRRLRVSSIFCLSTRTMQGTADAAAALLTWHEQVVAAIRSRNCGSVRDIGSSLAEHGKTLLVLLDAAALRATAQSEAFRTAKRKARTLGALLDVGVSIRRQILLDREERDQSRAQTRDEKDRQRATSRARPAGKV